MGEEITKVLKFKRGSIWWHNFSYQCTDTSVILGNHPCVIVSNDFVNVNSGTAIVVPLSSSVKERYLDVYDIMVSPFNGKDSIAKVSQIKTVDTRDLDNYQGVLPDCDMEKIDRYLRYHLGMSDERNLPKKELEHIQEIELTENVINKEPKEPKEEKHNWKDVSPNYFLELYDKGGAQAIMDKYDIANKQSVYAVVHSMRRRAKLETAVG